MKAHRLLMIILLSAAVSTSAGALTIKLGTLAPAGSPWLVGMERMAADWYKLSGGAITVRIYAGGVAGDESDMLRKMRFGGLDAAGITVSGLQQIFDGFSTLSYPLLIRSNVQLDYVLRKMEPYFERELVKRGFHAVMWSPGGWTYLFSRRPVVFPRDLKDQKLWVWAASPDQIHAYQEAGFQTVTMSATNLMMSLDSGMIDAMVTSPLLAASNQWFGVVRNMSTLRLAPLWGAVIISEKTWSEIPAALRPKLIADARKIAQTLGPKLSQSDQQAIQVMEKYGLKVNAVGAKAKAEWAALLSRTFSPLIGRTYDRKTFELASGYLKEFLRGRARAPA